MGIDPATGKPIPPIVGTTVQQRVGYPINAWFQRPYTFEDKNGDGVIEADEITVADDAQFVGYANPRWEITYTSGFDLFNRRLRLNFLFDHKSGYYQLNGTERIRCESRLNCRGGNRPHGPSVGAGPGGGAAGDAFPHAVGLHREGELHPAAP